MQIERHTLARLERGYSIAIIPGSAVDGRPAFLAGSEGDAELLSFTPPDFRARTIARAPGGFISIWPFSIHGRRFVAASTRFKPGFDAASCEIRLFPLEEGDGSTSTLIAALPYTHRVAMLHRNGRDFLLASTLCSGKSDKEDWSQPGGIHLAEVPSDPTQPWPLRPIVTGLNKNHGLELANLGRDQRPGFLLSAMEGLFFLPIPADLDGEWPIERIAEGEHSDAFAFDWDGDGEPEVFSISPFHGNVLTHHKKSAEGWTHRVIHDDLAFGHIVWAGELLGGPALLAGSRRERRELRLYRPRPDGSVDPAYEIIDPEIGPSQIAVVPRGRREATLYVAAHGLNEVRRYELAAG